MRFFRRIAGIPGFSRDDADDVKDQENDHPNNNNNPTTTLPFSKKLTLPEGALASLFRSSSIVLSLVFSAFLALQGLKWYAKRLRMDEDGDVADEFLDEILPETPGTDGEENEQKKKPIPKFEVKYSARPAKVKTQVMSHDGKFQQCVEYQGRLQWVLSLVIDIFSFVWFIAKERYQI